MVKKLGKRFSTTLLCTILACVLIVLTLTGCTSKNKTSQGESGNNESSNNDYGYSKENVIETNEEKYTMDGNGVLADYDIVMEEPWDYPQDVNSEEYNEYTENKFVSVLNNRLSTFSIDVDTASYTNVRRMINHEKGIDIDAVRIEEMINYFDYDYVNPTGDVPFSIHSEASYCPWNPESKLVLIGIQGQSMNKETRPKNNLVFLIDVSGSMDEEDKLPLVKTALNMLTEELTEDDRISIVTYSGEERVVLQGARGNEKEKIKNAINTLRAAGSTAGEAGITMAYKIASEYFIKDGNNRILLATDGDLNVGISNESELTKLIEEKRETGVFLSVLGFGTGNYKDNKLEALADNGNGNYSYIDSELEAKKVLVDELQGTLYTIAKDVKIQVEFNPELVKGYRLIGYENRTMNTEDFEDDKKDAGEIGAGHNVTALYEIVEVTSNMEIPQGDFIYDGKYAISEKSSSDWLTVKVRYKEPIGDESKLISVPIDSNIYEKDMPKNLSFASSVAAFGMILKDSEYKGSASYDMILEMLKNQKNSFDEYKAEFVELVKTMNR
jgi:Ca-activated chloride channel family protein